MFHEMVEVVNRTHSPLEIMYDGERKALKPNYDREGSLIPDVHNFVPKHILWHVLDQTCIMGTESTRQFGRFESKVGVIPTKAGKKRQSWNNLTYYDLKDETEVTRVSAAEIAEELIRNPEFKLLPVRGQKAHNETLDNSRAIFDISAV